MRKTETGKNHVRQNEIRKNKTYENSNLGQLRLPSSLLSQ